MCFALFMIMLDNTIVNVALPSIQRALHTTPETLQWTIDAYVLTFAVLILLGGKLGDRFGRKRMFLVGLAIFTLASAACALATTDRSWSPSGPSRASAPRCSTRCRSRSWWPRSRASSCPTAIGIWAGIAGTRPLGGPAGRRPPRGAGVVVGGLLGERADRGHRRDRLPVGGVRVARRAASTPSTWSAPRSSPAGSSRSCWR